MKKNILISFLACITCLSFDTLAVETCSKEKVDKIIEIATSLKSVTVDCNLDLKKSDILTKRLIFEGSKSSNVTVNCNGATIDGSKDNLNYNKNMIEIRSRSFSDGNIIRWERPENITIKNCNIIGSVRVRSMSNTDLKVPSRSANFVEIVRNNAPRKITFDNLIIESLGNIALYLEPGVSETKLIKSHIRGKSVSTAIYFDHESYRNIIKNNYIYMSSSREVMAIDGSGYNQIIGNKFSGLNHGGIYLYRNCGERGVIRHSTPSHNKIINNIFYYNKYKGIKPAVYLASRNGKTRKGKTGYCPEDSGYLYGSSADDLDYARHNVVMQNQLYKRRILKRQSGFGSLLLVTASIDDYIKIKNVNVNSPNYIDHNKIVNNEIKLRSGCYVSNGFRNFISHGESIEVFKDSSGKPICNGRKLTCDDGVLNTKNSNCSLTKINFDCNVSGNNNGCRKNIYCQLGRKIIGATAACNLEQGIVSNKQLASVPANTIRIVKPSDNKSRSRSNCFVDNTNLKKGEKTINKIQSLNRVTVGCKEHDKNGGDCHIKGILYCLSQQKLVPNDLPLENK